MKLLVKSIRGNVVIVKMLEALESDSKFKDNLLSIAMSVSCKSGLVPAFATQDEFQKYVDTMNREKHKECMERFLKEFLEEAWRNSDSWEPFE